MSCNDLEEGQHVHFNIWQGDFDVPHDVPSVKIIIAPARSIWDDFFDENNYENHTVSYELHKMENGQFVTNIPLKINTYHFLFRIDNCERDFTSSCGHHVTYLANGRKLNYVNVGNLNEILLNQYVDGQPTEQTEGLSNPVVGSGTGNPQSRVADKRQKRMFLCCYLD